jgi:hypothetical protein
MGDVYIGRACAALPACYEQARYEWTPQEGDPVYLCVQHCAQWRQFAQEAGTTPRRIREIPEWEHLGTSDGPELVIAPGSIKTGDRVQMRLTSEFAFENVPMSPALRQLLEGPPDA